MSTTESSLSKQELSDILLALEYTEEHIPEIENEHLRDRLLKLYSKLT